MNETFYFIVEIESPKVLQYLNIIMSYCNSLGVRERIYKRYSFDKESVVRASLSRPKFYVEHIYKVDINIDINTDITIDECSPDVAVHC